MPQLTIKEKARLFDELKKRAYFEEDGYGDNRWKIILMLWGDKPLSRNFTTALKQCIEDKKSKI